MRVSKATLVLVSAGLLSASSLLCAGVAHAAGQASAGGNAAGGNASGSNAQQPGPGDPTPPPPPPQPEPPPAAQESTRSVAPFDSTNPAKPIAGVQTADKAETEDAVRKKKQAEPTPLPWRGTTFTFNQAVTTTAVGIGRDNISTDNDYYGLEFSLAPQYYLVDRPKDKLVVSAEAGVAVELTNGNTLTRNEPTFKDTSLALGYQRTLWQSKDDEWLLTAGPKGRLIFPTSRVGIAQGKYLTTTLGASVTQVIKLFGRKADGLNNIALTAGFSWAHLFSRSFTPTDTTLDRTRQNAGGDSFNSDQLTFNSFDVDRLIPSITADIPLYKDLRLITQFRLIGRFKHNFTGQSCESETLTGCVQGEQNPDRVTYLTNSTFDIALTQSIYEVVDVDIGYNNETLTLGEDGKARNVFYSPDAQFYMDIIANIDVIYAKASGREKFQTTASESPPHF